MANCPCWGTNIGEGAGGINSIEEGPELGAAGDSEAGDVVDGENGGLESGTENNVSGGTEGVFEDGVEDGATGGASGGGSGLD